VTGFTLEGLLGRRGKLRSVGESESHSAREKMLQDELYLLCRYPLSACLKIEMRLLSQIPHPVDLENTSF